MWPASVSPFLTKVETRSLSSTRSTFIAEVDHPILAQYHGSVQQPVRRGSSEQTAPENGRTADRPPRALRYCVLLARRNSPAILERSGSPGACATAFGSSAASVAVPGVARICHAAPSDDSALSSRSSRPLG